MATPMGFEPTTSSVTGWHSNHLNYGAILDAVRWKQPQTPLLRFFNEVLVSSKAFSLPLGGTDGT